MDFYYEDCIDDFVSVCKEIDMTDREIRDVLNMPTNASPKTWKSSTARNHADVIGNWFAKELSRTGDTKRDSPRRCELYLTRRNMLNYEDTKHLRSIAPKFCLMTGQPINYGLGVTKEIYQTYFAKKYNKKGVSPSLERIDSNLDYSINNIEIISSPENISRNQGIDWQRLRKAQKLYTDVTVKLPRPVELLRLLQVGECKITFNRLDDTERVMNATLNLDVIPENRHPKGEKNSGDHIINVWDLDKQDWRSFSYYRLLKVEI